MNIEELAAFCKRKGIVFPTADIYGGMAGFYDYGPFGVEIKNNVKELWWRFHILRPDIVGMDGSIITNPKVWKASGHVGEFNDPMLICECGFRERADSFLEEKYKVKLSNIEEIKEFVEEKKPKCPKCGKVLKNVVLFGMMFKTNVGPVENEESKAYLRPETAQLIFTDFPLIVNVSRLKPPFGIVQIGKAFRNEISPRNFLFRMREFEQMELEYFVKPWEKDQCPLLKEVEDFSFNVLTIDMQKKGEKEKEVKVKEMEFMNPWHRYWISKHIQLLVKMGLSKEKLRARQQLPEERAHYSSDTWDLEYKFFNGWKELEGFADRGTYDLERHEKDSGKSLELVDEEKGKYLPVVIAEPSIGVDRLILAILSEAYRFDKERNYVVLSLNPLIAPIKVAVFPLIKKEEKQREIAKKIYNRLIEGGIAAFYDESGSIGRRYARMDEVGTPWCITVDHQSVEDGTVTIRWRDTQKQERVHIDEVIDWIREKINN